MTAQGANQRYDAIVVGVGSMGSATCLHLARRGARVLGLEQFGLPHAHGSHHGYTRMIRLAYHENPHYVTLVRRAFDLWQELERHSGQKLMHVTGGLYMGTPDCSLVAGSLAAARQHGLAHEMLDHDTLAQRYPCFNLPDRHVAFYESLAGLLLPQDCVAAMADQAMRRGARIHGHEPVLDWSCDDRGVTARTARATYQADTLIFCGGAWSGRLLGQIGVSLSVTRQVMGWTWPADPDQFALGRFPTWAIDPDADQYEGLYYGFPMLAVNPGFKIAAHIPATPVDPTTFVHDAQASDEDVFRPALRRLVPDADGPLLSIQTCLYTNSPDGHFIIDRHPNHPRVLMACGFSGHGFKFAAVVGEALADMAVEGETELPIGFLGLSRFNEQRGR